MFSEPQLAKEPFVLACLVTVLELGLHLHTGLLSLCLVLDDITSSYILIKLNVDQVACWHEMCIVVAFDEWLDTASLFSVLLVVFTVDLLWISVDSGNNCVSITLV